MNYLPSWLQALVALAPLLMGAVATGAVVLAWRTLAQREKADARVHWWDRTRWAIDCIHHDDPRVWDTGAAVLILQVGSELARKEEVALMEAVFEPLIARMANRGAEDVGDEREYGVEDDIEEGDAGDEDRR